MAVLAPTPRAMVRTAVTVNTGRLRKMRTATTRSWKGIGLRLLGARNECKDFKFEILNLKSLHSFLAPRGLSPMPFHDLVVAVRILRKRPVFTVTAVLTIALGVGASTAIFSVTNAVLLQLLPYKHPGRLVIAGMDLRQRHVRDLPFSNADFIDLKEGTKELFEDMAGVFTFRAIVPREDGTPEQIRSAVVTTHFFPVTGGPVVARRASTP